LSTVARPVSETARAARDEIAAFALSSVLVHPAGGGVTVTDSLPPRRLARARAE
jgi:hypothetical protein